MVEEVDGGISALGGYLYQIIAFWGITAELTNHQQKRKEPAEHGIDILLQLTDVNQSARIQHEALNQDMLISTWGLSTNDKGVFIQFKYSVRNPPPTVSPTEVHEILRAFDNSVERAREKGLNITACILVTNRRFAHGCGTGGDLWQKEQQNPNRTYQLREIVEVDERIFIRALYRYAKSLGVLDE